jgi:hypothetical protein
MPSRDSRVRVSRRWVRALVVSLLLVVGLTTAAVAVTQTAWFKNWLRGYIVREANRYLNGQLSIGRLGGNLFYGVELENIGLIVDGRPVVTVKDLGVEYNAFELVSKGLSIHRIRINEPTVYLTRTDGTWSISRVVKREEREADRTGPARPIALDEIGVSNGTVVFDGQIDVDEIPKRIDRLDAKLAFKYEPVRYTVDIAHVSFRATDPAFALNSLSGTVSVKEDTLFLSRLAVRTSESSITVDGAVQQYLTKPTLNLKLSSDKTSLPEIGRIVPALAKVQLQPAYEVSLDGPVDHLGVGLNVRSAAGEIDGRLVADLEGNKQSLAGDVDIRHLDLAPILADSAQKSDITAKIRADIHGPTLGKLESLDGTIAVTAPHAAAAGYAGDNVVGTVKVHGRTLTLDVRGNAYGARATAAGPLSLPEGSSPFAYDLKGRVQGVDLRRLPPQIRQAAATDINADYHVAGHGSVVDAQADLLQSTVAGASIAEPGTAGFSRDADHMSYRADVTVANVDLQQMGRAFDVQAIQDDRYKSALNGHIVVSGEGTTAQNLKLTASGTLNDSVLAAGRVPTLTFETALADDALHVKAAGAFVDLDPARLSGKANMAGMLAGDLDGDATLAGVSHGVTTDSVQANGRLSLKPSTIGGLTIESATIDGAYRDATGEIRQFELTGRDLNAKASGTLALNDTGQSNLTVHAETSSLENVMKAAAKQSDKSVSGIGTVDATVTGNKRELRAAGTLTGGDIAYGGGSALAMMSAFAVSVPDLAFSNARLLATTNGTFVVVGGQTINELTAKTDYDNKQVVFEATAKQPQRSLTAAGSLKLNPDQNEVALTRLALQSGQLEWQTPSDSHPTIRLAGDTVSVHDLRLVSGNEEIAADGTFGGAASKMKVDVRNMDLATVDALMLRQPVLSGTLNASAEIGGTQADPTVNGRFDVSNGGFRQVHYDSLGGTIDYAGKGLNVDAKLQQTPEAWLTAKGYVPIAALKAAQTPGGGEHHEAAGREDTFNLHIESTPIELGLVQGMTTALTNVKGTVQAKLDVTGAAQDPHPNGAITVQNAAFTVQPTGVTYTNLEGRVELEADRVHIVDVEVLDNDKQSLSITGDLALHERQLGGVNVNINARNFKVIGNDLGSVRVDSDLSITGELARPRIEGELGVTKGVLNLDPILESVTNSGAATSQTEYTTRGFRTRTQADDQTTGLGGLSTNVHLMIANDFVVKSNDITAPDAPIGLGAVNMTLGGDLRIQKNAGARAIRLVGTVNTVRGTYDFQGRRFTILRDGTVLFDGLDYANPGLNVTAQRTIQGVQANVNIRGTLKMPEVVLTSVPPLERSEILSLIVFNQPINNLGEGQQVALTQRAEQMASGVLATQLTNSLGKALNLTEFDIQTGPDSGAAAQITAGEQLSQNLYAKIEQGIGDVSTTNVILEYELAKWLRLRTNWLQGSNAQPLIFQRTQDSGVDLLFFFTH